MQPDCNSTTPIGTGTAKAAAAVWEAPSAVQPERLGHELRGLLQGVFMCNAGNKVVEYTDRTAAEVDEMIKERQERNKVLREP